MNKELQISGESYSFKSFRIQIEFGSGHESESARVGTHRKRQQVRQAQESSDQQSILNIEDGHGEEGHQPNCRVDVRQSQKAKEVLHLHQHTLQRYHYYTR